MIHDEEEKFVWTDGVEPSTLFHVEKADYTIIYTKNP